MPAPIDFRFDFSSPHGYLASERIVRNAAFAAKAVPALCQAFFAEDIDIAEAIADGGFGWRSVFVDGLRSRGRDRFGLAERWPATAGW